MKRLARARPVRTIVEIVGEYLAKTVSILWLGPVVAALIIIPEFVQHVAEINLGMFDSRETAVRVASHPWRMGIGYVKIAGLVVTFFASARFWWCRVHGGRWFDVRTIAWGRLVAGAFLFFTIGSVGDLFPLILEQESPVAVTVAAILASLPFLFVALAGLFGDRHTPWRTLLTRSWPYAILLAVLLPLLFMPLSVLHSYNHRWAMGTNDVAVWGLMAFDSLVVGLMATSVGAAFSVAYARFHQKSLT